jgi:GT2 family glycosyltransferase/SAM-dependent methyltransferase
MEYAWDNELNLFRRANVQSFAYSDGAEVEQRLFAVIQSASDKGTFSSELSEGINDWPSEYHLSRARHCLIRPLGIKKGDKVLELGCGCGALTRYLGEIGAEVVAVEGSIARARIAAERCRDLENVKVFVDDLLRYETNERFDWILLIGVLEYAPVFSDKKEPAQHYLQAVAHFLAPEGRLVIAIENKLGLKYFNGCSEDHLGVPFLGIQDLYGTNTPRTFGRRELLEQLAAAGFIHSYFYYPFPDYKLPAVVISEDALSNRQFDPADLLARAHARDYTGRQYRLFDEALVFSTLNANGLLGDFSNSFLVVATLVGATPYTDARLAMTFAVNRIPEFAAATSFHQCDKGISVIKEPLFPEMPRNRQFQDGLILFNKPSVSTYHLGPQLLRRLLAVRANTGTIEQVIAELRPWLDFLLKWAVTDSESEDNVNDCSNLRSRMIPGRYLDCTPFNLIETHHGLIFIDDEWQTDHLVSLGWVITRGILQSLSVGLAKENSVCSVLNVVQRLSRTVGLLATEADIVAWLRMEMRFQSLVTGQALPDFAIYLDRSSSGLLCINQNLVLQEAQIISLDQELANREAQIISLDQELAKRGAQIISLDQELAKRDNLFAAIQSSTSWRITKPMRLLGDTIKGVRHLLNDPKSIYRRLRWRTRLLLERLPRGSLIAQAWLAARRYQATWWEKRSDDVPLAIAMLARDRTRTLFADWHRWITLANKVRLKDIDLPRITVTVVLHNSKKWLNTFMESLLGMDYTLDKVTLIFVDNESTDDTVEHVNDLITKHGSCFNRIELIKCPNVGYGAGNHAAILKSDDDFVLVTNVDVEFDHTMLRILAQTAVSDAPDVACWEPMQVPYEHPKYYDPVTLLTNWCSHACVLIRRAAYLACGGYDKRIFMYGEDVELSFRLRSQGSKLRYVPSARILHHVDLDDSQMARPKLILQISGSLAANALLRYRYGRWRDIWVGEVLLRILKLKTMRDDARNQAARVAISTVLRHRLHFLRSRHRGDAYFPFIGVDFDLRRDGAFHRRKFERSASGLPRVSIITRTVSHRWWLLSEAIASVVNQTYPNIEHIIVEDGSSEFQSKINELRCSYSVNIRHLQSSRGGRSAAGNVGLEASSGEFFMFLDDDDLLFPDHVETLVERLMEAPQAIGSYSLAWSVRTDIEWQTKRYREVSHDVLPSHKLPFDHDRLLVCNFASIQAVLFRQKAYAVAGGFHEDLHALEDWNLWCRFAMLGDFVLVEKLTSLYRVPAEINQSAERQKVLNAAYERVRERNLADRAKLAGL